MAQRFEATAERTGGRAGEKAGLEVGRPVMKWNGKKRRTTRLDQLVEEFENWNWKRRERERGVGVK